MSQQIALKTRGVASVSTRTSRRWMEQLLGKDLARMRASGILECLHVSQRLGRCMLLSEHGTKLSQCGHRQRA